MDLNAIWFVLMGVLLAGYAVLDGFDLGVGILHPFAKDDRERRIFINSIGPIWDGNEVWLVTFGGALFAAFPEVYATAFSALYLPFMLLLLALILRAVSIEFRSKIHSAAWRRTWDWAFFGSSLMATILFGVTIGNSVLGMALSERGVYTGSVLDFLMPYPLLVAALSVAMFAMHGAVYLRLKTSEGPLRQRIVSWIWTSWGIFLALYFGLTIYTLMALPHATKNFEDFPWAFGFVALNVLAVANIPRAMFHGRGAEAFLSSSATILALVALFGVAMWPNMIAATNNPDYSLTVYNAASSQKTLQIMFTIVLIGMPFVLSYTAAVYWTFRGRADVDEGHY